MKRRTPEERADLFNREHPVGTLCRYWIGNRDTEEPRIGRTLGRAEVIQSGGDWGPWAHMQAAVQIAGCRSWVPIVNVEPIAPIMEHEVGGEG